MSSATAGGSNACHDVIRSLSDKIDAVLNPLLPPGTPCAVVDFPNHPNAGDSAIWAGESAWWHRRGLKIVYACDVDSYRREHLAERLPTGGVILIHGGGNLGDFWYNHQELRERVVADFPNHRIIQLPQTIKFCHEWTANNARKVFDAHRDLTILCRDQPSVDFARKTFKASSLLCPDMAFGMGALQRPEPPGVDISWLSRTDTESQGKPLPKLRPGVERTDWWQDEPATPLRDRNNELTKKLKADPSQAGVILDDLIATYDPLAEQRVLRGCKILGRGKVVISDRLHAHILCLLMGIPHVVLDNFYGKIRGFYDSWTHGCSLAHWATTPEEALDLAESLVRKS